MERDWTYSRPNLLDQFLEDLLSSFLGAHGVEPLATSGARHGLDLRTRGAVDVLDDLVQRPLQLVAGLHVLRLEDDGLDVTAGEMNGGDSRLAGRGRDARRGSGSPGSTIGGSRTVAVGPVTEDIPLGHSLGGLRLGTPKLREELTRLGVELGVKLGGSGGCVLLLSSCFLRKDRRVHRTSRVGMGLEVLVDNVLDGDMVALMLLLELLGNRHGFFGGSHCVSTVDFKRETIQETKRYQPEEGFDRKGCQITRGGGRGKNVVDDTRRLDGVGEEVGGKVASQPCDVALAKR